MPLKLRKFAPLLVLAALMLAAYATGLREFLGFDSLKANRDTLQALAHDHPALAAAAYIGSYVLCAALSLPAATFLTLLGGFLFGKWAGTALVVIGATAGATVVFLVARSSLGAALLEKAGTLYHKIEADMQRNAVGYLLLLRLVPLFPFWMVNIAAALFNISLRIFVLTTFFGIIPATFVYVNVGEQLAAIDRPEDIVSGKFLLAFALLGLCALLPAIYRRRRDRRTD